jgi:hypothetical protein
MLFNSISSIELKVQSYYAELGSKGVELINGPDILKDESYQRAV